ncbi:mannose-6-phosphate isomerase [Sphingopyxis terrae subsp. ummariensis]|nr:mannose-6-phosphate isomerase [Sphingopyxis terrae subsp. ummariensis]
MDMPPPFAAQGNRVGEIWFDPPPGASLLVKYLFTSQKLSVQVHPDDAAARAAGAERGKEECWYIVAAEPGAQIAVGTKRPLSDEELAFAASNGELEDQLQWHPAEPGGFFHIPPGTIHAIGPGIELIEIQQNSDITYRLFDYGRPRALHIAEAVAAARAEPMRAAQYRRADGQSARLLDGPAFGVALLCGDDRHGLPREARAGAVIPLSGSAALGRLLLAPGQCGWTENIGEVALGGGGQCLVAWAPGEAAGPLE